LTTSSQGWQAIWLATATAWGQAYVLTKVAVLVTDYADFSPFNSSLTDIDFCNVY